MRGRRRVLRTVVVGLVMLALLSGGIAAPAGMTGHARGKSGGKREAREVSPANAVAKSAPDTAAVAASVPQAPAPHGEARARAVGAYGKAPLSFEANQGQSEPSVKFLSRGAGYQLYLTSTEAVLALHREPGDGGKIEREGESHSRASERHASKEAVVRMQLLGARPDPRVSGEEALPGRVNYLTGRDPRAWRTNVATYGKVRYENVYRGIDLVYYGNQKRLEYDFHLAPGADPGVIRLGFKGVRKLELDAATGELVMRLPGGEVIRQHKPVLYQEVGGARREVAGRFVLRGGGQVGFEVGTYDKSLALVIDPVLVYATYFGGNGEEATTGMAVDSAGSVYVTGAFRTSPGFPVTANAFKKIQNDTNGSGEVFITKFAPDGAGIVYSTLLGGSSSETSTGIAIDPAGNAYVTGWTISADFPVRNAFQSALRGLPNPFLAKLNAAGSDLLYSSYLGGSNYDFGTDIAADASGNAYITGETISADFPVTPGALRTNLRLDRGPGDSDGFVAKLDTNASGSASLVYSTFFDIHAPYSNSIDIDAAGNAYVTGRARVQKLNAAGSALLYSFTIPDAAADNTSGLHTTDIAVDAGGHAYVTGFINSPGLMIVKGFQAAYGGGAYDGFMAKLDPSGASLLYSTYLGGSSVDSGSAIAVDSGGHAYVAGDTASADFPTRDAFQNIKIGNAHMHGLDIFVTRIDTGSAGADSLVFSTYYGASNHDEAATGVALDAQGNIYATGFPFSINIPVIGIIHTGREAGARGVSVSGDESQFDPFILKISDTSQSTIRFGAERLAASEGAGSFEVTVTRGGDTSASVGVDYATIDGQAWDRYDYSAAYGTLRFAPGETSKTFRVLITDDANSEGDETLYVILRESATGVALASPSVAELTITDNDASVPAFNPIDRREFFVRQHYLDFFNREPDAEGFQYWVERISAACEAVPSDAACVEQRVNVSGAFFLSIEFLNTGYFVYRLHKASFGSLPRLTPFQRDTQEVGRGVVVGQSGWEQQLEQNKQRLVAEWIERADFKARYDALTNEQYVDTLNANTGNSLSAAERSALVAGLNSATETRAGVLRRVAENEEFSRREFSPAFVLMQYFGYLRRDPDPSGYQFWLNKLNRFDGDYRRAEMVKAFITSGEYRNRFGSN